MELTTLVVIFVAGMLLMVFEIFVPGGILGLAGVLLMGLSVTLAYVYLDSQAGLQFLIAGFICSVVPLAGGYYLLQNTSFGDWMVLEADTNDRQNDQKLANESLKKLEGKEGKAMTDLSPSGWAKIGGERYDVVSDGFMVEEGTKIRVRKVEANQILVEEVEEEEV